MITSHSKNILLSAMGRGSKRKSRRFMNTIENVEHQRINEPCVFLRDSAIPKNVSASRTYSHVSPVCSPTGAG